MREWNALGGPSASGIPDAPYEGQTRRQQLSPSQGRIQPPTRSHQPQFSALEVEFLPLGGQIQEIEGYLEQLEPYINGMPLDIITRYKNLRESAGRAREL